METSTMAPPHKKIKLYLDHMSTLTQKSILQKTNRFLAECRSPTAVTRAVALCRLQGVRTRRDPAWKRSLCLSPASALSSVIKFV